MHCSGMECSKTVDYVAERMFEDLMRSIAKNILGTTGEYQTITANKPTCAS